MRNRIELPSVFDDAAAAKAWRDAKRILRGIRPGGAVVLDVSKVEKASDALDAFATVFFSVAASHGLDAKTVDPRGFASAAEKRSAERGFKPQPRRQPRLFEPTGRAMYSLCRSFADACGFLGETVSRTFEVLRHPSRFRFRDFMAAFGQCGADGLPVVLSTGFLLGLILAFESAAAMKMFGVEIYSADLLSIALFRELGPLVTAIMLAGRSGSAFAAEIAAMKANEEIDALVTMRLPPVRFLVLPRIAAATAVMPALAAGAELAGLLGGAIVLLAMDIPPSMYWERVADAVSPGDVALGLAKAALFGLLAGLVGCWSGLAAEKTADGVGGAATRAVVGGITAAAVADGVLAAICWLYGI